MPEVRATLQAAYYRRLAAVEARHPWFTGTRRVAGAIIPVLLGRPSGGLRILDVGCGTGATLRWLRRFAGRRPVVGMDLARGALRFARRGGEPVILASAEALPFRKGRFDLLYCADVIQHLPAPARTRAYREFARVLRPGGVVLLRANRATGAPEAARPGYPAFDYRTVPAELEEAGLTPVLVGTLALLSGLAARWRRGAGGGWQHQGLALRPLTGLARPLGWVIGLTFWLEALAFRLRRRLPARGGASSLVAALKVVPFERA